MIHPGPWWGGEDSIESWAQLLGAGMPNVGGNCQATDAQPCFTDGDGCPAGTSRHTGEPRHSSITSLQDNLEVDTDSTMCWFLWHGPVKLVMTSVVLQPQGSYELSYKNNVILITWLSLRLLTPVRVSLKPSKKTSPPVKVLRMKVTSKFPVNPINRKIILTEIFVRDQLHTRLLKHCIQVSHLPPVFPFSAYVFVYLFYFIWAWIGRMFLCLAILLCVCLVQGNWKQTAKGNTWVQMTCWKRQRKTVKSR